MPKSSLVDVAPMMSPMQLDMQNQRDEFERSEKVLKEKSPQTSER